MNMGFKVTAILMLFGIIFLVAHGTNADSLKEIQITIALVGAAIVLGMPLPPEKGGDQ